MGSFIDLLDLFGIILEPLLNSVNLFLKMLFNDMPVIFGLRPGGWMVLFLLFGFIFNKIVEVLTDD